MRNKIEAAASDGLSCVDVVWSNLIQDCTQAKIENFIDLKKNTDGTYKTWTPPDYESDSNAEQPSQEATPWKQIVYLIDSYSNNYYSLSYSYKVNEQYPYGFRLSWRNNIYTDDNTNDDTKDNLEKNSYFIIENNAINAIDATKANTITVSGDIDQYTII